MDQFSFMSFLHDISWFLNMIKLCQISEFPTTHGLQFELYVSITSQQLCKLAPYKELGKLGELELLYNFVEMFYPIHCSCLF